MSILNSVIITAGAHLRPGAARFGRRVRASPAAPAAGRTVTYYLFLIAIILPAQLGTVPLYIGARSWAWPATPWGMIMLYIGMLMPLSVFLYAGFFRGLPHRVRGGRGHRRRHAHAGFFRVVLPLMAPATGTVAILAGLIVWNDFFTSLIFLGGSDDPDPAGRDVLLRRLAWSRRGTRSSRS